jgi:GntR family transcriptional regulator/MocR family aminotransferase
MLPLSQWREKSIQRLSSGGSRGIDTLSEHVEFERLRYAICNYLLRYKGIRCDAGQLNIFANRRQALESVASRLGPNEVVAIDNTTAPAVQKIFTAFGAELRHINTESEGTSINELNALPESCGLFLTTPTDEYLLGSVMPQAERLEILRWARHRSVTILEEASECESQYCPSQIPSLYELSGGTHVNYLYSFGKMLNPLTDVTVIVSSKNCTSSLATKSSRPSLMETAILADLIVDGAIDSFIRRRHRHYRKLRQAAYFETTVTLGRFVKISPEKCAHHLVVDFSSQWSTDYILKSACDAKLSLTLFADYYAYDNGEDSQSGAVNETFSVHPNRFLLNFLGQSPEEIADKIRHFAGILTREIAV